MHRWFVWLALACFLLQQFTCCGQGCGTCVEPTAPQAVQTPCDHDGHHHEHQTPCPTHEDSSHHLCVATHLFYLTRSDSDALQRNGWIGHVALPLMTPTDSLSSCRADAVNSVASLRPPASQRLRAALGVWIL